MHVLHVAPYYAPAWSFGGVVAAVTGLAEAQSRAGHQVTVLTTDALGRSGRIDALDETLRGVRVVRRRIVSGLLRRQLHLSTPLGFRTAAVDLLRETQVDLVHFHELRTVENLIVAGCAQSAGIPRVVSPHGTLPYTIGSKIAKRTWDLVFATSLVRRFDHVIALTGQEAGDTHALWNRFGARLLEPQVSIVPNGVAPLPPASPAIRAAFRRRWQLGEGPVILFLGRLAERKGLGLLITAFDDIVPRCPGARLLVVGPDEGVLGRMKARVRTLGLEGHVTFAGLLVGEEKLEALASSDIFALPAHGEGHSIATLEAMAMGLPVVISDSVSMPELEAEGAGIVVRPVAGLLAEALADLAGDAARRLRMGQRGRALVAREYTWADIAARMDKVYQGVLRRGHPPAARGA